MTEFAAEPPAAVIVAPGPIAKSLYRPRPSTAPTFLSGGYVLSFVDGPHPATGHGVELSLLQYLTSDPAPAIGPVVQLQNYSSRGDDHLRLNAGAEVALLFGGLELMYSYRAAFAGVERTHGVTLGPFLTLLGIVHVAGRFTIALSPDDAPGAGNEYGVTLGLKVPALIAGDFFTYGHGRPCTIDGRALTVALRDAGPWLGDEDELSAFWRRAAEQERASVVAFRRLALSLAEREAPRPLLEQCLRAEEDELRHSELARRRAEQSANRRFEFEPHEQWLSGVVAPDFAELALESLLAGCLGEGVAARILAAAADESAEPELAAELREVAADEARHAELGWAVLAFCLERDREAVMRELVKWLCTSAPGTASLDDARVPRGHGSLAPVAQTEISEQVWSEVVLRLGTLLD